MRIVSPRNVKSGELEIQNCCVVFGVSIQSNRSGGYWDYHKCHRSGEIRKRTETLRKIDKKCENCSATKSTIWGFSDSKLLCRDWFVNQF